MSMGEMTDRAIAIFTAKNRIFAELEKHPDLPHRREAQSDVRAKIDKEWARIMQVHAREARQAYANLAKYGYNPPPDGCPPADIESQSAARRTCAPGRPAEAIRRMIRIAAIQRGK